MNNIEQVKQNFDWVGRYVAVIVVALILAAVIGNMDLFAKTFLIQGKLSAAHFVRFLGYSTALAALWLLGQRVTIALQQHGGRWTFVQHLILPVVTLIVVSSVNSIALLILKPMMSASMNNIYNWIFIIAILACAGWVLMAVLGQSASLTEAFTSAAGKLGVSEKTKVCADCGSSNEASAKFCKKCGKELADNAA